MGLLLLTTGKGGLPSQPTHKHLTLCLNSHYCCHISEIPVLWEEITNICAKEKPFYNCRMWKLQHKHPENEALKGQGQSFYDSTISTILLCTMTTILLCLPANYNLISHSGSCYVNYTRLLPLNPVGFWPMGGGVHKRLEHLWGVLFWVCPPPKWFHTSDLKLAGASTISQAATLAAHYLHRLPLLLYY